MSVELEYGEVSAVDYLTCRIRVTPYLVRETVEAIRRWEIRVSVVQAQVLIDAEHITLRVVWRVADGVAQITEVPYA